MRKVSEKICGKNTHFMGNNFFFRKTYRSRDNVEKCCTAGQTTDGNIIWRMRFACRITKATDTHSEYVLFIAFAPQKWLGQRASALNYTQIASYIICPSELV